jgi:predicted oxidoreductase
MRRYTLANSTLEPSVLSLGTMHLGGAWDSSPLSSEIITKGQQLIFKALELGINHLDLADIYTFGKSEQVVGRFLKQNPHRRDHLILHAKCGIVLAQDPRYGPPKRYDSSYQHIVDSVESTLRYLSTDRVEVLSIHRPDPLTGPDEIARAFEHLKSEGKVLHFGVSNYSKRELKRLQKSCDQPLLFNQLELSLHHHGLITDGLFFNQGRKLTGFSEDILAHCTDRLMVVQAWSPVSGGSIFQGELGRKLTQFADSHGATPEAIALAWLLRHPAQIQPIVGTQSLSRLENLAKAPEISLSREEWYELLETALGCPIP